MIEQLELPFPRYDEGWPGLEEVRRRETEDAWKRIEPHFEWAQKQLKRHFPNAPEDILEQCALKAGLRLGRRYEQITRSFLYQGMVWEYLSYRRGHSDDNQLYDNDYSSALATL